MNKILPCLILTALSAGAAMTVHGAAPVYTLRGITVTATRQAEDLQDVPASVQVVTEKQIKERNIQNAAQAVAMAAGVAVDQSIEPSVSVRGYDSKNILVLVDGQQMNSGWNGETDWGMIPADNISRIEVVSGGQSALYGGRAVGGVINIMTKTARQDGVSGSAYIGYGSHNSVKQSYAVNGKSDKWSYGAFYENRTTDGWRPYQVAASSSSKAPGTIDPSGLPTDTAGNYIVGDRGTQQFLSESYGFNLGYQFSEEKKLTYRYSHSNYTWKYNDPASYIRDAEGRPVWEGVLSGADKSFKATNFLGTRGWRAYDTHSLTYNDQENKIHAHFGLTDYTKDGYTSPSSVDPSANFDGTGTKSSYPSRNWSFDLNKRWTMGAHTVLLGGTYGQERFDQTRYGFLSDWKDWDSPARPHKNDVRIGGKSRMWSVYAQDKWQVSDRWAFYIGGRYDRYTKYDGYSHFYDASKDQDFRSASYGQFSPKLSLDYALDSQTNVYLSYGKSFNPPILYQVYRSADGASYGSDRRPTIANPDLKPETTTNWELGLKKKIGDSTEIRTALFYAETEDYIKLVKYGENNADGWKQYQNVGEAKTRGAEISLNHTFSPRWSGYINYTWQTGQATNADGTAMSRSYDLPRHLLHTGLTYAEKRWTVTLDGMFISSRNDPDEETYTGRFGSHDPYFVANMTAGYQYDQHTLFQFTIRNLLDREFYDDELTEGRAYNLSVRYTF